MNFDKIQTVNRNGNLHIKLSGDFDSQSADQLSSAINQQYLERGNVFVNAEKIGAVLAKGAQLFRQNMVDCPVPQRNFFMIGQKDTELVPDDSRVIVPKPKKKKCTGCGNCNCGKNK